MRFRPFWAAFALCAVSLAEPPLSVQKLFEAVKSSIAQKSSDKDLADWLATVQLTNRLEDQTIEELQSMGAGSRTVTALKKLGSLSAKLPAASSPLVPAPSAQTYVQPPPPPDRELHSILTAVREYALTYAKALPDFICVQLTNRSVDPHYKPVARAHGRLPMSLLNSSATSTSRRNTTCS
jgi:hypothetical protein